MTGSSIFCSNLRNRRNPSNSNYHMSINNCQAIQKSGIDRKSKAWFTLGSKRKTLVSLGWSRFLNYLMTDSPSSGNRANWSCTSYRTICQLRSIKRSLKNFFIISMRICRIARSWHPSPVSVFPVKRDAYSWRKFLAQLRSLTLALYLTVRCSFLVYCCLLHIYSFSEMRRQVSKALVSQF